MQSKFMHAPGATASGDSITGPKRQRPLAKNTLNRYSSMPLPILKKPRVGGPSSMDNSVFVKTGSYDGLGGIVPLSSSKAGKGP